MQAEAVFLKDILPYLRRKPTYIRRAAYGGLAASAVSLGGWSAGFAGPAAQAATGAFLFDAMLWTVLAVGLLEAAIFGATSVSSERQSNTYDTWMLAGMEHFGVVLAKCLSVLARVFSATLAPLCPMAVALYLGGRSVADAVVGFLAVMSILIFVTALSVSVSAFCRKNSDSIAATAAAVLGFAIAPGVLLASWGASGGWGNSLARWVMQVHPFALLAGIGTEQGPGFVFSAVCGFGISVGASFVSLSAAGLRLQKGASGPGRQIRPFRALDGLLERVAPAAFHLVKPRPGDVDKQPVRWRERVALSNSKRVFGAMTVSDKLLLTGAGVTAVVTAPGVRTPSDYEALVWVAVAALWVASFVYTVSFMVRASQAFSREFESGDVELLCLADMGDEIAKGKIQAYVRHFTPVAAMDLAMGAAFLLVSEGIPSFWDSGPAKFFGPPPVRAMGLALSGLSAAGISIFASLYFRKSTVAMLASLAAFAVLPCFGAMGLTMVFGGVVFAGRMWIGLWELQLIVGGAAALVALVWQGATKRKLASSQRESIVPAAIVATFVPPMCGLVAPFLVLGTTRRLIIENFGRLMEEAAASLWRGPVNVVALPRGRRRVNVLLPQAGESLGGPQTAARPWPLPFPTVPPRNDC